jgi:Glycosyl hydrolases related to GH101 family, GH129/Carbohydrate binding domain
MPRRELLNMNPRSHTQILITLLKLFAACALGLATAGPAAAAVVNGGFEDGLAGWKPLWTRTPGAGACSLDRQVVHSGRQSARIEHHGERDWSFETDRRIDVQAGDLFEMEAWLKLTGPGSATLCVTTLAPDGHALAWDFGGRAVHQRPDWVKVTTRFIVPPGVAQIQPRLIGYGVATVWVDDFAIARKLNVQTARRPDLPPELDLTNATLVLRLNTSDGTFSVTDRRTAHRWSQTPFTPDVLVKDATAQRDRMTVQLLHLGSGLELTARLTIDPSRPELTAEVDGSGELPAALKYPYPFASEAGQYLVIPMNEGISYPVEDASIEPMRLIAYGGHGICMAFWGVTDGKSGQMAILETPDDAAIRIGRTEGKLAVAPEWDAQKGQFGYARRVRYIFFDTGGHVAMCKRYRAYAKQIGIFKTLAEKRQANPNVDLLIGAANLWCWDRDPVPLVREIKAAGLQRILWSDRQSPEGVRAMNDLGILTSRYDIYQDLMNPANFPQLGGVHPDWTTEGWPKDIMINRDGSWTKGWQVRGRDNQWYACGVLCDRVAPDYARRRIPADLATHPYRCRFIDTTTASPWRECYSPDHPLTRSESRHWKMELLRYVSEDARLVTGSETGHDAAVPFVHYFEGMLSLGPYRVPDAGRDMQRVWTQVPERVAKFQLGQRYRLPLWELVFHDCVVAQWYWGDYNNKLPALWPKRDLFNVLYGTPPMFMFTRRSWSELKDHFVRSYRTICPVARKAGYSEMLDHRFLTPDRDVQQTVFANGVTATVNFGSTPFRLNENVVVPPLGSFVSGM